MVALVVAVAVVSYPDTQAEVAAALADLVELLYLVWHLQLPYLPAILVVLEARAVAAVLVVARQLQEHLREEVVELD